MINDCSNLGTSHYFQSESCSRAWSRCQHQSPTWPRDRFNFVRAFVTQSSSSSSIYIFRRNLPGILSRTPWHFPRNGILFNDPRARRSFEKSSRPPQSKLFLSPSHPPFFSCSLSNEILPLIHPGIKISSATTSLFSQLRNPSRKRANSTNNRAFSRPSLQRQHPLFS